MPDYKSKLKTGFLEGIRKGFSSFLWMARIAIPVSLAIALLQWSGWINRLDFLLDPYNTADVGAYGIVLELTSPS